MGIQILQGLSTRQHYQYREKKGIMSNANREGLDQAALAQSIQGLHCALSESLDTVLPEENVQNTLHECTRWSRSYLLAYDNGPFRTI